MVVEDRFCNAAPEMFPRMTTIEQPIPAPALTNQEMTWRQWLAVSVCVFLNVIDGFDILVMSTAAGAVRQGLGLSAADLGLVLSASLAGMTLGALFLAPLADRFGRRRLILSCLTVEMAGMLAAGFSTSHLDLMAYRLIAGLGVGGMMPVLNTAVAEVSSRRRRNVAITLQAAGYPAGGLLAALFGGVLLGAHGWRLLLQSACAPTTVAFILVVFFAPESVAFLLSRRSPDALNRANAALKSLGKPALDALPPAAEVQPGGNLQALVSGDQARALALFATATFLTQFSFYFFLSWLPTVLQPHLGAGFPKSGGSMILNFGGIVGDFVFGVLCLSWTARKLTLSALVLAFASVALIGPLLDFPGLVVALALMAGASLFAAMAGIYATAPEAFPPRVRASGTGFAFSLGRFGGTLSPVVGAYGLSAPGLGVGWALILMGLPLVGAAALLTWLRTDRPDRHRSGTA